MTCITYYFNGNQSLSLCEDPSKGRRILWGWIGIVDILVWDHDFSHTHTHTHTFAEGVKQRKEWEGLKKKFRMLVN